MDLLKDVLLLEAIESSSESDDDSDMEDYNSSLNGLQSSCGTTLTILHQTNVMIKSLSEKRTRVWVKV